MARQVLSSGFASLTLPSLPSSSACQSAPGVVIGDRLVELPDLPLDVPARCTVTLRHVSSPHFTYLIRWTVVIGDRLVELPDLQPFLALQLSLAAWEEELRLASLALQLLDVPARCTVMSSHVSSPHFTYLIRWIVTSPVCRIYSCPFWGIRCS